MAVMLTLVPVLLAVLAPIGASVDEITLDIKDVMGGEMQPDIGQGTSGDPPCNMDSVEWACRTHTPLGALVAMLLAACVLIVSIRVANRSARRSA